MEIIGNTNSSMWHHVRTERNPADCISRGLEPKQLAQVQLWWHGPEELLDPHYMPQQVDFNNENINEVSIVTNVTKGNLKMLPPFENCSNMSKTQRVLAYVLRFINKCKNINMISKKKFCK